MEVEARSPPPCAMPRWPSPRWGFRGKKPVLAAPCSACGDGDAGRAVAVGAATSGASRCSPPPTTCCSERFTASCGDALHHRPCGPALQGCFVGPDGLAVVVGVGDGADLGGEGFFGELPQGVKASPVWCRTRRTAARERARRSCPMLTVLRCWPASAAPVARASSAIINPSGRFANSPKPSRSWRTSS